MNGPSILNNWLNKSDPIKGLTKAFEIYHTYNTSYDKSFGKIKRWWIENVSYPLYRWRMNRLQIKTITILYNHPDLLIFILSRFLLALKVYSDFVKFSIEELLDQLFPDNSFSLQLQTNPIAFNQTDLSFIGYNLVIRSFLTTDQDQKKYAITSIEADLVKQEYTISQIAYDTDDENKYSTADILYTKEFRLGQDGKLSNPNYILDKSLLDNDLIYYKLIVSQIMAAVCGFFDEITRLYYIQQEVK